ncbi:hypothetical protein JCM10212_005898 [Sporobolomyces blumeae]
MSPSPENGFVVPPPQLAPGFSYQPSYDDILSDIANTNDVDTEWPDLREMLKHKLAEAITAFLSEGPPYPLSPEDAFHARSRAFETLDSFTGPPFTIQRVCELSLHPRKSYTSLAKYLRAMNRVLSVTSDRSSFTEDSSDDHPLVVASTSTAHLNGSDGSAASPGGPEYASLGIVQDGVVLSPAIHTHRRGSATPIPFVSSRSPSPSPSAVSDASSDTSSAASNAKPQVVPLLSPIPWLTRTSSSPPRPAPASSTSSSSSPSRSLSSSSAAALPIESARPLSSTTQAIENGLSTSPNAKREDTATPTGGLVDEVDPGSGGQETADPIALSSATTIPPTSPPSTTTTTTTTTTTQGGTLLSPPKGANGGTPEAGHGDSLRSRFVRASSPKVEVAVEPGSGEERERREGGGTMGEVKMDKE